MILSLTGVLADASIPAGTIAPAEPTPRTINWPQGESGTIRVSVIRANHVPANITGGTLILGVRRHYHDDTIELSRQADLISSGSTGIGEFPIVIDDTRDLEIDTHRYDVHLIDSTGARWQVIPASDFNITEIESRPDEPVSVPTIQQPLAQGPQGLPGSSGAGALPKDIQLEPPEEQYSDGMSETWLWERAVDFDQLDPGIVTVAASLVGLTQQTGGASGDYRIRLDGTIGDADGTEICHLTTTSAIYATPPDRQVGSAFARPSGRHLVKLTARASLAGARASIHAARIVIAAP